MHVCVCARTRTRVLYLWAPVVDVVGAGDANGHNGTRQMHGGENAEVSRAEDDDVSSFRADDRAGGRSRFADVLRVVSPKWHTGQRVSGQVGVR